MKYLFIIISIFTISCNFLNPSSEIKEAFETISSSLEISDSISLNSLESNYKYIDSNKNLNIDLFLNADTLYKVTLEFNRNIESAISQLRLMDSSGMRIDIGNKYLFTQKNDNIILTKIKTIVNYSRQYSKSIESKRTINNLSLEYYQEDNYFSKYCTDLPTVALITYLRRINSDVENISNTTMLEIKAEINR